METLLKMSMIWCCRLLFFFELGSRLMRQSENYFARLGVASMDGSRRRSLFRTTEFSRQTKMTLDRLNKRIYFTESFKNQISSIDYNGSDWSAYLLHYATLQCFALTLLTLYHYAVYYLHCLASRQLTLQVRLFALPYSYINLSWITLLCIKWH